MQLWSSGGAVLTRAALSLSSSMTGSRRALLQQKLSPDTRCVSGLLYRQNVLLGLLGQSCWRLLGFPSFHASFCKEMVWGAKEGSQVRHCLPEKPNQWAESRPCPVEQRGGYTELLLQLWGCVPPWKKWGGGLGITVQLLK